LFSNRKYLNQAFVIGRHVKQLQKMRDGTAATQQQPVNVRLLGSNQDQPSITSGFFTDDMIAGG
jgi:hypothetical protein